jgi:DNA-binding Lrp family transcriptional regulator
MVTAIVLMNVQRGLVPRVGSRLSGIEGISEVYSVSGDYDLVALIRVASNEALANLVTETIAGMDGIEHTHTMLAFHVYSRHDLEAMFSIGD